MLISPGDILDGSAYIASLGISFILNDTCVIFGLEAMVAQLVFGHGVRVL
jgi:hypothetical protein